MRREELHLADLVDNARVVRGYLDGVTRERWDAEDILRYAVLYRIRIPHPHAIAVTRPISTSTRPHGEPRI